MLGAITPKSTGASRINPSNQIMLRGDRGADVEQVQQQLNNAGARLQVDGIYGPRTRSAVREFQRNNGLKVDGVVGTQTQGRLDNLMLGRGEQGRSVSNLQGKLRSHGFQIAQDGQFGPKTEAALKQFQQANGIDPTGIAGSSTFQALQQPKAVDGGALRRAPTDADQRNKPPGTIRAGELARAAEDHSHQSGTVAKLNKVLGGALKNHGQTFVDAGKKHGVDPKLLGAISMHETGNGTSRFARQLNNVGGIMDPKQNWMKGKKFSSIESGVDYMASNLKRNYINKGLTTVDQIQKKYAPIGARNDSRGYNKHWVDGVNRNLKRID